MHAVMERNHVRTPVRDLVPVAQEARSAPASADGIIVAVLLVAYSPDSQLFPNFEGLK
jgi:hypothetical protein